MNVCMPGMCICDAAEWEGDTGCNASLGLPEPWKIEREGNWRREEKLYRPSYQTLEFNQHAHGKRNLLPQFKGVLRVGPPASEKQMAWIRSMLSNKIIPDASFKFISDFKAIHGISRESAAQVINYLKECPQKMKRVTSYVDDEWRDAWEDQDDGHPLPFY